MNEDPDLTFLKKFVEEEKDNYVKHGESSKDAEQYMFEEVMQTFYGRDFFDKVREMHK